MDITSYYDVAKREMEYLDYAMTTIDGAPFCNNFLIQEQQICEKMLKDLVQHFVFVSNVESILKSHKLVTLVRAIEDNTGYNLNLSVNDLRFLSDFYFDGRYPSIDYLSATKEDALRGYEITKIVISAVDGMKKEYKAPLDTITSFE